MGRAGRLGAAGLVVVLAALTGSAWAGFAATVIDGIEGIARSATGGIAATYRFRDAANDAVYRRTVQYSRPRVAGLAKARLFSPAAIAGQLALAGVLNGVGWFIDEAKRQVLSGRPASAGGADILWTGNGYVSGPWNTAQEAIEATIAAWKRRWGDQYCEDVTGGPWEYSIRWGCGAGGGNSVWAYNPQTGDPVTGDVEDPPPVSDDELVGVIEQHPEVWPELLQDPATGAIDVTPELADAKSALDQSLGGTSDGSGGDTVTVPDQGTTPTDQTADQGGDQPTDQPTDWPGFCAWAGPLCRWLDWTEEPAHDDQPPTVPTRAVGDVVQYDSGLGAGRCPPTPTFEFRGQTFEIPIQPACDALSMLAPIVIGVSYLIAASIVVRV